MDGHTWTYTQRLNDIDTWYMNTFKASSREREKSYLSTSMNKSFTPSLIYCLRTHQSYHSTIQNPLLCQSGSYLPDATTNHFRILHLGIFFHILHLLSDELNYVSSRASKPAGGILFSFIEYRSAWNIIQTQMQLSLVLRFGLIARNFTSILPRNTDPIHRASKNIHHFSYIRSPPLIYGFMGRR